LLSEPLRQPLSDQARRDVGRAGRGEWHDQTHRPRRIGLRLRDARHGRQRGSARGQMQKISAGGVSRTPPSLHIPRAPPRRGRYLEAEPLCRLDVRASSGGGGPANVAGAGIAQTGRVPQTKWMLWSSMLPTPPAPTRSTSEWTPTTTSAVAVPATKAAPVKL